MRKSWEKKGKQWGMEGSKSRREDEKDTGIIEEERGVEGKEERGRRKSREMGETD